MPGQSEETKIAVVETELKNVTKSVDNLALKIDTLTDKIDNHYVKKEEFNPVKLQVESLRMWQAKVTGISIASALAVDYIVRLLVKS